MNVEFQAKCFIKDFQLALKSFPTFSSKNLIGILIEIKSAKIRRKTYPYKIKKIIEYDIKKNE